MLSIPERFVREFTRRLILESAPREIKDKLKNRNIQKFERKPIQIKSIEPKRPNFNKYASNLPTKNNNQIKQPIHEGSTITGINKIKPLLFDRNILSIECPGPNKPLLINKKGFIQTINVSLTKPEIDGVVEDFSKKTSIPLIEGIFKAFYKNLAITAVVSEYVGTRFIIQKRMPAAN